MTTLDILYKQVDDFKTKLVKILSDLERNEDVKRINRYYDKLLCLKKVNTIGPVQLLYSFGIIPYAESIARHDDSFFLGKVNDLNSGNYQDDILFVQQISAVWDQLSDKAKDNIWKYIDIICLLTEKALGKSTLKDVKQALTPSQ